MRAALILVVVLAGCASSPAEYGTCTVPITRDAGMGVQVPGCAAWQFGRL
jgi:hypothetical protein